MNQVEDLLGNEWIEEYAVPWGSMIVLAQKPHQKHIKNIDDFVWCMFVSHHQLYGVTKSFQFHILRCYDAVMIIGWGAGEIWIISLDARQGCHQVSVRKEDRKKLAFFAPNDRNYCFNIMPFGTTNDPTFYTTRMKDLKDEWDKLFSIRLVDLGNFDDNKIWISTGQEIMIGGKNEFLEQKLS